MSFRLGCKWEKLNTPTCWFKWEIWICHGGYALKSLGLSSRVEDAYKVFHRLKESNIVGVHYLLWYCSYFVMFSCPRCILQTWSSSLHQSVTTDESQFEPRPLINLGIEVSLWSVYIIHKYIHTHIDTCIHMLCREMCIYCLCCILENFNFVWWLTARLFLPWTKGGCESGLKQPHLDEKVS